LFDEIDTSETVGWFTSLYPLALDLPQDETWKAAITSVKGQLRAVPDRGVGYGALRYLSENGASGAVLAEQAEPQLSFNFHGQFTVDGGQSFYRKGLETERPDHHPAELRAHVIDIVGVIQDGRLTFLWGYSTGLHRKETVEMLARNFAEALAAITETATARA
jgi:non-ribosomal peptide synthase protein (TIGR01720 family)